MAQMPFSPCEDGAACTDASVSMLEYVFGKVIDALVRGADPDTVATETSTNLLATMFNHFNSGILVVGSLVVSYVVVMGMVNTANDGEALGQNWSSIWTPVRIVSGAAVLLPSTTGYSFIQIIVLMFALWGVGFSNGTYKVGMAMGILSPDGVVQGVNRPGSYYGLREFARNYLAAAYCAKAANAIYTDEENAPRVSTDTNADFTETMPDKATSTNGRTEYSYYIKDRNEVTNLAGGQPFCGTVNVSDYQAQAMDDPIATALENVRVTVHEQKRKIVGDMILELDRWVNNWPTDINQPGWENVDSDEFNQIVGKYEDRIAIELVEAVTNEQNGVDSGLEGYLNAITQEGWAGAGGWFQRVGMVRSQIANVIAEPLGTVTQPSLSALPSDARAALLLNSVSTATEAVAKKAEQKLNYAESHTVSRTRRDNPGVVNSLADMTSLIPKDTNSDINPDAIRADMDRKMSSYVNTVMLDVVEGATGANSDGTTPLCGMAGQMGGSLYRMKCIGDYLNAAHTAMIAADIGLKTVVAGLRVLGGTASSAKVLGTGFEADKVTTPIWDWVEAVPVHYLSKMSSYVGPLAFYFGIVLPSLPYGVFMIVVVGWLLSVLQGTIAATLWAVMHMTPDRTFVGSQTQGYLLLLSIFTRPVLAILGLFAAVLISDPVIDFIAKGFFAMRGAVVSSTGTVGAIAEFSTFTGWLVAFGLVLLPVLYMIFSLPQILPDHVLRWIGVGISDLGETNAIGQYRSQLASASDAHPQPQRPSLPRKGNPMVGNSGTPPSLPGGSGSGGGGKPGGSGGGGTYRDSSRNPGSKPVNVNPQGATNQYADSDVGSKSSNNAGKQGANDGNTTTTRKQTDKRNQKTEPKE